MPIQFDLRIHSVNESMGTVKTCASVVGGVVLEREVVVLYQTANQSAIGMKYLCE